MAKQDLIDQIIQANQYDGGLVQDGWETTELTVRHFHPALADQILARLKEMDERGEIL